MPGKGNGDPFFQGEGTDLKKESQKVLAALSGGVDSAVTAWLLKKMGFNVHGLFVRMTGASREEEALSSAEKVSRTLDIPFHVVDKKEAFRRQIIGYFLETYRLGKTPNPCVVCNPCIKIEAAAETADRFGITFLATGHYARIKICAGEKAFLLKGRDMKKDQSYFLNQVGRRMLRRLIMPLGDLFKKEVEGISSRLGLTSLIQKESQDVCFLKDDYRHYFRQISGSSMKPGPIKTTEGRLKGEHRGLYEFTIGQRRGLGIPDASPYYVIRIEPDSNTLVIGKRQELFKSTCRVTGINWQVKPAKTVLSGAVVKLRSRHAPVKARLKIDAGDKNAADVYFQKPQSAVTPGQFAVFYRGALMIGGGTICE